MTLDLALDTLTLHRDDHVLLIGLNRPEKRNAFNVAMLTDLSLAYGLLESDEDLRVGVLFAHGDHFTAGLDLVDVAPYVASGQLQTPEGGRDPWRLDGDWTKPMLVLHGSKDFRVPMEQGLARCSLAVSKSMATACIRRSSFRR